MRHLLGMAAVTADSESAALGRLYLYCFLPSLA